MINWCNKSFVCIYVIFCIIFKLYYCGIISQIYLLYGLITHSIGTMLGIIQSISVLVIISNLISTDIFCCYGVNNTNMFSKIPLPLELCFVCFKEKCMTRNLNCILRKTSYLLMIEDTIVVFVPMKHKL